MKGMSIDPKPSSNSWVAQKSCPRLDRGSLGSERSEHTRGSYLFGVIQR